MMFHTFVISAYQESPYLESCIKSLKAQTVPSEIICTTSTPSPYLTKLMEKYQIPLVLITLGKDGSRAYYKDLRVEVPGFVQEHTIETTGAGDTFCANSLNYILEHGMEELTEENLKELLTFANAAASLITTRKGALRVMPTREEIENFIQNV